MKEKSGRTATYFKPSTIYTINIYLKNNSQQLPQITEVILALKDDQGKLISLTREAVSIAANATYTYTKTVTMPAETTSAWKMYCYLWDDFSHCTPLYRGKIMLP